ncbi:MAG: nicotinate phosphoribosyltransferase, partial [Rhizobium sp.]|nr:nicotinate phosphoribosyltransferase [Rhizobium sp.]
VVRDGTDILAIPLSELGQRENLLKPVWQEGRILKDWGFEEVRQNAAAAMQP